MPQLKSGAAKLNELVNLKDTIVQKSITFSYCYRKVCIFAINPKFPSLTVYNKVGKNILKDCI